MARYRDDDEEDDDDRPRRRRRGREADPPRSNTPVVLVVVILVVGLPLLACAGFGVWGVMEFNKTVTRFEAGANAAEAGDAFFAALARNDVNAAYDSHTTAAFRTGTSRAAFAQLVKQHPVLTASHIAAPNSFTPTPVGTAPTRTATLTYTVEPDVWEDDPDEPAVPPPTKPKPGQPPKAVTCTVVVAEQPNGVWKVDKFTIP
jgi:hypothetical protein